MVSTTRLQANAANSTFMGVEKAQIAMSRSVTSREQLPVSRSALKSRNTRYTVGGVD